MQKSSQILIRHSSIENLKKYEQFEEKQKAQKILDQRKQRISFKTNDQIQSRLSVTQFKDDKYLFRRKTLLNGNLTARESKEIQIPQYQLKQSFNENKRQSLLAKRNSQNLQQQRQNSMNKSVRVSHQFNIVNDRVKKKRLTMINLSEMLKKESEFLKKQGYGKFTLESDTSSFLSDITSEQSQDNTNSDSSQNKNQTELKKYKNSIKMSLQINEEDDQLEFSNKNKIEESEKNKRIQNNKDQQILADEEQTMDLLKNNALGKIKFDINQYSKEQQDYLNKLQINNNELLMWTNENIQNMYEKAHMLFEMDIVNAYIAYKQHKSLKNNQGKPYTQITKWAKFKQQQEQDEKQKLEKLEKLQQLSSRQVLTNVYNRQSTQNIKEITKKQSYSGMNSTTYRESFYQSNKNLESFRKSNLGFKTQRSIADQLKYKKEVFEINNLEMDAQELKFKNQQMANQMLKKAFDKKLKLGQFKKK
ncbi:hypothetical protein PPERSA_06312 [Pseudocohnilembus persalinus]|uniref:Uncharacterized protein n=1 Tax=Pseudocohnilembus persalinus TaxID=266149 RepID=A0A0V0QJ90_PSEPJ|nr:hypothetical protein PPERSA_06312 [Pseudocohnilembus persalinus]|eukprot:KRX02117.1 hypothetical protein PPERSA_06312 [Pseudocohnilembus persalinus]